MINIRLLLPGFHFSSPFFNGVNGFLTGGFTTATGLFGRRYGVITGEGSGFESKRTESEMRQMMMSRGRVPRALSGFHVLDIIWEVR